MEMFPFGCWERDLGICLELTSLGLNPPDLSLPALGFPIYYFPQVCQHNHPWVFPFIFFPIRIHAQVSQHNHSWVLLFPLISTKQIHPQSQMAAACPDKQKPSFHGNEEEEESWNEAGLSIAVGVVSSKDKE